MSGEEINPADAALHELSDEELDEVAGGLSLSFVAAVFEKNNTSFDQKNQFGSGGGSTETVFETQNIKSAVIQISVTGASTEDLELLSGLLGDTTAIEGSS